MFVSVRVIRAVAIGTLFWSTLALPQSQRDQVCQGSCGGGCGPCPNASSSRSSRTPSPPSAAEISAREAYDLDVRGVEAYDKGDWTTAEALFKECLEKGPSNRALILKNLAAAQNSVGVEAYNSGDYPKALSYFQQALANDPTDDPNNHVIREDIDAAKGKLAEAERNKSAFNDIHQTIQGFSQTLTAAPSSGKLDFDDQISSPQTAAGKPGSTSLQFLDSDAPLKDAVKDSDLGQETVAGPMGTRVARPKLTPEHPIGAVGSNTKSRDQLLSAAATAKADGDLTINYDKGGAQAVGSLPKINSSIDPAGLSPKVKSDPRMISALKHLGTLKATQSQLNQELQSLTARWNSEKDPKKFADLSNQLDQKNNEYQANFLAITRAEQQVRKTKQAIEAENRKP